MLINKLKSLFKKKKLKVTYKVLDDTVEISEPRYAHEGDAGLDLRSSSKSDIILYPKTLEIVPTSIAINLPDSYEAQVRSRSGLAGKNGVFVLNAPGTIDTKYKGELQVILYNLGDKPFIVKFGDRVAQLVIAKYESVDLIRVDDIGSSERGNNGFGSTGVK